MLLCERQFKRSEKRRRRSGIDLKKILAEMSAMQPNRLQALVSVESLLEDLDIAENSAKTILEIKEGLIGPARQRNDDAGFVERNDLKHG